MMNDEHTVYLVRDRISDKYLGNNGWLPTGTIHGSRFFWNIKEAEEGRYEIIKKIDDTLCTARELLRDEVTSSNVSNWATRFIEYHNKERKSISYYGLEIIHVSARLVGPIL